MWDKHYTTDTAYINQVDQRDNHKVWRFFFHCQIWDESLYSFVPVANIIDLDTEDLPGALSLNMRFNSTIRTAAGVGPPPVLFAAGKVVDDMAQLDAFIAEDQVSSVADPIVAPVASALAGPLSPRPTKTKWIEKKPAGDVVSELSGPVASTTSTASASVITGPALAAVAKPCGSTDIRLKQASALAGPAKASSPRGKAKASSPRALATGNWSSPASRSSALAGNTEQAYDGLAPWQQEGYRHPDTHTIEVPEHGHTFGRMVANRCLYSDRIVKDHCNCEGVYMAQKYTYDLEHATNKCIRHSKTLKVSKSGWAYLTDVVYTIWCDPRRYNYVGAYRKPTEADVVYAICVSNPDKQRFIISALNSETALARPFNIVIKAVQGVSSGIGDQMEDASAYRRCHDLAAICHYTKLSLIDDFIGFYGKGIVPGGIQAKSSRTHCYFVAEQPPNNGCLPNSFQKAGTDCVIELNPITTQADYECLQTENGTVLIGARVRIQYMARITLLGPARYTVWLNPSPKQMLGVTQTECKCSKCSRMYVNGTQWCYNRCWVPLTWLGVKQRFMAILDKPTRDSELRAVYGLTQAQLPERLNQSRTHLSHPA